MQERRYLKGGILTHVKYHGVLCWNEIAVDWLNMVMWFGTFSSLGARMLTRDLRRPLFVAQTTSLGTPDFCKAKGVWVKHGVKDHELRDGNDV